ncbi:YwmB family TATA-box binding protein [Sporolactobacillus pectinivorans]|uniref:YwmB family TATA-box binding protein n=1 Tax=Sporolactobacillus pectinivorans TaxID=1591408 RepID=UPI000C259FA5|nr:YwmB family TATA-box binding protein [Sporolactobacillus pectinivorans]
MKRNITLILIVWLVILMVGGAQGKAFWGAAPTTDTIDRVQLFAQTLQKNQAEVVGWSVFAREEQSSLITQKEFERETDSERKNQRGFNWHFSKNGEGVLSWEGLKNVSLGMNIRLIYFAYPAEGKYRTATLYQSQSGSFKQTDWLRQKREMREDIAKIFHKQVNIFSCVRAYDSDKMKLGLLKQGDRYLKLFSAAPIERDNEKTFVSISAYNEAWNNSIISGNRQMNYQVALRNDGERTTITMGTPIITLEY